MPAIILKDPFGMSALRMLKPPGQKTSQMVHMMLKIGHRVLLPLQLVKASGYVAQDRIILPLPIGPSASLPSI